MGGYPGVNGLDARGEAVVDAHRTTEGYLGAASPKPLTLAPGAEASALLEGNNGATSGGPPCPTYVALAVTPPGETHSVRLQSHYPICYPVVHPLVAGAAGGARG